MFFSYGNSSAVVTTRSSTPSRGPFVLNCFDPKWAAPVTSTTGYAVAAVFYLIFCYAMSRYARAMEIRLGKGDRH